LALFLARSCLLVLERKMEDRWLSVDEIGDYLGVKRDTVYKWIADKSMPAHRIGRLWKFKKEQIDTWVEAGGAAADANKD
jgi:excisionase family DNA binding protein